MHADLSTAAPRMTAARGIPGRPTSALSGLRFGGSTYASSGCASSLLQWPQSSLRETPLPLLLLLLHPHHARHPPPLQVKRALRSVSVGRARRAHVSRQRFAALETAAAVGDAEQVHVTNCLPIARRLYALLTGLIE